MRITVSAVEELDNQVLRQAFTRAKEEDRDTIRDKDIQKIKATIPENQE